MYNKTLLGLFALAIFLVVSCGEAEIKKQVDENNAPAKEEILKIESQTKTLEKTQKEIEESKEAVESALKDLDI